MSDKGMDAIIKRFEETTPHIAWINSNDFAGGRIYTIEFTEWLERENEGLRDCLEDAISVAAAINYTNGRVDKWKKALANDPPLHENLLLDWERLEGEE